MSNKSKKLGLSVREITIFAAFASMMFLSTALVKMIPNVHFLALFIGVCTLMYRTKALIPLYAYILLDWALHGFTITLAPHLYIWLPLWFSFMIVGKIECKQRTKFVLYLIICGLHGLCFGILYAPAYALMFGLSFDAMIAWIVTGFPFDIIHAAGNVAAGTLIIPLLSLVRKLDSGQYKTT